MNKVAVDINMNNNMKVATVALASAIMAFSFFNTLRIIFSK